MNTGDNMTVLNEKLISIQQAADLVGLQPKTIYNWTYEGKLPAFKIGRSKRIKPSDLEKLVKPAESAETYGKAVA